jgi:peroxiredoxin
MRPRRLRAPALVVAWAVACAPWQPVSAARAARTAEPTAHAADTARKLRFPSRVTTIDGESLDVVSLAATSTLVVVTLKATSCPVCQRQLMRLNGHGAALRDCGVRFLVLAPGPRDDLAAIRERTGFAHPFVEDSGLKLADSLGLRMGKDEIVPAMLLIEPDLTLGWTRLGRSGANYGEQELLEELACAGKLTI